MADSEKISREPAESGPAAPTAAPSPSAGEVLTVQRVARELGVAVEHIEHLQGTMCVAGEDFVDLDGAAVFTPAGAQKIRERVREEMQRDQLVAPAAPPAVVPPLQRADLRLTRVFPWSNNLLAETPTGNEVVVGVRTNRLLEKGMVLRGCIQAEHGSWLYEGRLPRVLGEKQLYFPPKPAGRTKGKK